MTRTSIFHATDEERSPSLRRAFLVRHGETAWSLSGQHTSFTDLPLTANGRKVARRLKSRLATTAFALVLTSSLRRARQTCDLAGLGDRAEIDDDLREWNYGEYEGLTTAQIVVSAPGWTIFRDGCPGGESPIEVAARVDRIVARVRSVEGDVALFGHGHAFRALTARWLGLSVAAGARFLLDTGTVSALSHYRAIPAVKRWNDPLTL